MEDSRLTMRRLLKSGQNAQRPVGTNRVYTQQAFSTSRYTRCAAWSDRGCVVLIGDVQAWSDIVSTLNPHVAELGTHLSRFASLIHASEVVLFERTTMLVIGQSGHDSINSQISENTQSPTSTASSPSHALVKSSRPHSNTSEWPEDRFAKISQAIKIFRLACGCVKDRPICLVTPLSLDTAA